MCLPAESLQSCLILCYPVDCSLLGSSVHGIFQARILEWLPRPPPGNLSDPGIKPVSLTTPALAGGFFTTNAIWEALYTGLRKIRGRDRYCFFQVNNEQVQESNCLFVFTISFIHSYLTASCCMPKAKAKHSLSCVWLFATLWTVAYQAPLPGASVRNSTRDKVMRQRSDGQGRVRSQVFPRHLLSMYHPKIRICLLFHSSDIPWKKSIQGFSLLHLKECFNPKTPLMAF